MHLFLSAAKSADVDPTPAAGTFEPLLASRVLILVRVVEWVAASLSVLATRCFSNSLLLVNSAVRLSRYQLSLSTVFVRTVESLAGGRAEVLEGCGAEACVMLSRTAAALAIPKELPLARVASSIDAWELRKFSFHFAHVLSKVGSSSHFSWAVGTLFLARMELIGMAVSHASKMGRAARDEFLWPSSRRFTYLGMRGYSLHQPVMVFWRYITLIS